MVPQAALALVAWATAAAAALASDMPAVAQTRLCLVSIVKNEGQHILRMLDSVAPHITSFCVCDTGSSDGTPELVQSFMGERGVQGHVAHHTWQDFGHNRSLCFDEAAHHLEGLCDYWVVADADHELVLQPGAGITSMKELDLSGDCYMLREARPNGAGNLNDLLRIFSTKVKWRYEGRTHEAPARADGTPCSAPRLIEAQYVHHADGGNRATKFERDRDLLLATVAENPSDARAHFYLGEVFTGLGDCAAAIAHYARHRELGGWAQEAYVGWLTTGECAQWGGGALSEVATAYAAALAVDPLRQEAPYRLARAHRLAGDGESCFQFARFAHQLGDKAGFSLFLERRVYRYGVLDELCVCSYAAGEHEAGVAACNQLLSRVRADIASGGATDDRKDLLSRAAYNRDMHLSRLGTARAAAAVDA